MKKILIAVLVLALLVGAFFAVNAIQRSRARKALAAYKAELRAQGEWLTLADAGHPFTLETNANLESFVALANQLRAKSSLPGSLDFEPDAGPGKLPLVWRLPAVPVSGSGSNLPPVPWERLVADCESAAKILAELRTELKHPPRRFGWDYTNPFASDARMPPGGQWGKPSERLRACLRNGWRGRLARPGWRPANRNGGRRCL